MPVYSFSAKINGNDVTTTYGFLVATLKSGNWDSPDTTYPEIAIPGRPGTQRTSAKKVRAPRTFVGTGVVQGTSPSDFEAKLDALKYAADKPNATVIGGNASGKQIVGTMSSVKITTLYPSGASADVEFSFYAPNPLWQNASSTVSGSSGSDLACPLGTAECYPVLTATSPSSPLVWTYKASGGTTLTTMTVTFPGSPTTVSVDCGAMTCTVDAVRHDEYITSLVDDFIIFDPQDGDFPSSAWPTVRGSSGSISAVYSKTYL